MDARSALHALAEVTESQWGMVTSAQARALGVTHMTLTRLSDAGDLVRLAHGVYRDAGAPSDEFESLKADWLAIEPQRLAFERMQGAHAGAVVSGESATLLHGMGDFRAFEHEFTLPYRKQTQRSGVRYRMRELPETDVTIIAGLPVTTRERTIADLVEGRRDLSTIADALADAVRQASLDTGRLTTLLAPLAERNGYRKGDGAALLDHLMRLAGLTVADLVAHIAKVPQLESLVVANFVRSQSMIDPDLLVNAIQSNLASIDWTPLLRALESRLASS